MPRERCPDCDQETPHMVAVEILEESDHPIPEFRKLSREPYRIATCTRCGNETQQRMNNA